MDLAIAFECPQCKRQFLQDLVEFSPGKTHVCEACGSWTVLTSDSLRNFQSALEDFCRT